MILYFRGFNLQLYPNSTYGGLMNISSVIHPKTNLITGVCIVLIAVSITACSKTEEELCIDKQSHLWDNKTNDKSANKAYWDAVAKCKKD